MVTLYLHDCYSEAHEAAAPTAFHRLVTCLGNLMAGVSDRYRVLIDKLPSSYAIVGNTTLKELVERLGDKDMRRFAFSIFNKYPIEDYYSVDDVFGKELPDYLLNGRNGLNLYAASVSGFVPTSLPLDGYRSDELTLTDENGVDFPIVNFYGENIHVLQLFLPDEAASADYLDRIRHDVSCKICFSDEFEKAFKEAGVVAQRLIHNAFKSADGAGLLFPCKDDNKRMKKFEIDKRRSVYELRALATTGFRMIVNDVEGELRVALFYTKAEANRNKSQRSMALRGWNIIHEMKSDLGK